MNHKISVIGCGGCGINSLNRIVESFQDPSLDVITVDTSESNEVSPAITERYVLGTGFGSGKDRSKNSDALIEAVPKLATTDADVTIVISSASGGSGNVIANLILSTLLRANKRVVFVMVCHTNTLTNAENTRKAFKSLQSICGDKYQVPCFIYDNKSGRKGVDESLVSDMVLLLKLLAHDYAELDDTDKLRFLTPKVTGPNSMGIYTSTKLKSSGKMDASENQLILPDGAIIPSVISINKTGDSEDFIAMEDAVGVDPKFSCVGISGIPISPEYLTYLGERLEQLKRMKVQHTQMQALDDATESVSAGVEL